LRLHFDKLMLFLLTLFTVTTLINWVFIVLTVNGEVGMVQVEVFLIKTCVLKETGYYVGLPLS
jgi:hypothetical protein